MVVPRLVSLFKIIPVRYKIVAYALGLTSKIRRIVEEEPAAEGDAEREPN